MIAAINKSHEAVLGIGHTAAEARADAYENLKTKQQWMQDEGIEPLEFAPLKPGADLDGDGLSMYLDVIFENESVQMGMNFE